MSSPEKKRTLRVASVQLESQPAGKEANFAKIERFTEQAAAQGVRLIVFPECCITGYWFIRNLTVTQLGALAEPIPMGRARNACWRWRASIAFRLGQGWWRRVAAASFITVTWSRYRMARFIVIANCTPSEHAAIACGTDYTVFDLPDGFRASVLICYDCNLVENVRITALRGAEVLIAPHQTGAVRSKNPHLMGLIDRRLWENPR